MSSRKSGVLMHISSLPGDYSIGSFGAEAKRFIDYLEKAHFTYWQVLPFCMADECNSPYKSLSAFGGNPYFIDLPTLYEEGLLDFQDLENAKESVNYACEFEKLNSERLSLLFKASQNVLDRTEVKNFIKSHEELGRVAKFMALRDANGGKIWNKWTVFSSSCEREFFWEFVQFEFFRQWKSIKEYANGKGIKIIGDLPIYVAYDSADVYFNREQFLLDSDGYPTEVAGVPPDYFSSEGQLWGNPIYNWAKMKNDGYSWWNKRLSYALELFDGVRIDHFRGLESYWSIPYGSKSAKMGRWVKGPSRDIVDVIKKVAGDKLIIAEDLGDITEEVKELLEYSGFPGMRVFQFAFLGDRTTCHLPHNYTKNSVCYTGTHDNNTLLGYVWELDSATREEVQKYCGAPKEDWAKTCEEIIRTVFASHADTVILPVQDLLSYGADTRMNTPGTDKNNWAYRLTSEQLQSLDSEKFKELNYLFDRG